MIWHQMQVVGGEVVSSCLFLYCHSDNSDAEGLFIIELNGSEEILIKRFVNSHPPIL